MKMNCRLIFGIIVLLVSLIGCASVSEDKEPSPPSFPTPPESYIEPSTRASYVLNHLWDGYTHLDTTMFRDKGEAEQFYVNYFAYGQVATPTAFGASLDKALSISDSALNRWFLEIAEKYLYDPNSPTQNEDLYALVMCGALQSGVLEYGDSVRFKALLTMYERNKPGALALDFDYVTSSGAKKTLYTTSGKLLVLMFYTPGCDGCRMVSEYIETSESLLSRLIAKKQVQLLCIYTDNEVDLWRNSLNELPHGAIVGHNVSGSIINKELYDTKASPTLYLLSSDKQVIIRDATLDQINEYLGTLPIGQEEEQRGGLEHRL